jgi:P27 family predicted phage terminase small subunit
MGERGPPRKPTPLRLLHGEQKDRINRSEPKPEPRDRPPSCPSYLKGEGRNEWRRRAPDLHQKGLLTDWDLPLFEQWCIQVQVKHQAYTEWAADGFAATVTGYRGGTIKHPALQAMRDAATTMLSISKRFGFTPSDRAGIEMPKVPSGRRQELETPQRVMTRNPKKTG